MGSPAGPSRMSGRAEPQMECGHAHLKSTFYSTIEVLSATVLIRLPTHYFVNIFDRLSKLYQNEIVTPILVYSSIKETEVREKLSVLAVKKESVLTLLILIAIAVAAPIFIKQQLITGTIVNATLIIATVLLSTRDGLLMGLLPSSIALATGLLSPVLAPMVPFIIVGNAILVLTFAYFQKLNFWAGVAIGAILKFAFLYGTSAIVMGLLINKQVAPAVAQMLSWPQLFTALAGGLVAFGYLKLGKKI
jgi:riboflavin transporter